MAVSNGQLLAIGGFDGQSYLKSVEVLDPVAATMSSSMGPDIGAPGLSGPTGAYDMMGMGL